MRTNRSAAAPTPTTRSTVFMRATWASALLVGAAFLGVASPTLAQRSRHADTWAFGTKCRMQWSADGASATTSVDPRISTNEGSAAFSDPVTGELLLYTDGNTVWNGAGAVLATGLMGDSSSMHAGVIVPAPGRPGHVWIFGHPSTSSSAVTYREFDTSGAGTALGSGTSSVALPSGQGREGMVVIPHTNRRDYWLVVSGASSVFVIPVTPSGIGAAASYPTQTPIWTNGWSLFAASPDGRRIAISSNGMTRGHEEFEALPFDPTTGVVGAGTIFTGAGRYRQIYGGAFSPDGTKLYFSRLDDGGPSYAMQYDFTSSTFTVLHSNTTRYTHGDARMGPDGRMYMAGNSQGAHLHVIEHPNAAGAAAGFSASAYTLAAGCTTQLGIGQALLQGESISLRCGDGVVEGTEACDDGNTDSGDGCSAGCAIETGWTCGPNLRNGGFEEGTSGANLTGTALPGWTITSGNIDLGTYPHTEGLRAIDLSGCAAGTIQQSIATVAGASYDVLFDYGANTRDGLQFAAEALAGSTVLESQTFTANASALGSTLVAGSITFTATSTSTTLRFRTVASDGCSGNWLDNVRVGASVCAAVSVPTITTPAGGAVTGSTPSITGTCVAGATVTVREGTSTVCTATCTAANTYSCTPSTALSQGAHTISASQVVSGTASLPSADRPFTVLDPPTITSPTEGASMTSTPAFSGACVTGSTVTVREGTSTLCTATCTASAYSCTPSATLAPGAHAVTATQSVGTATSAATPVRNFAIVVCLDSGAGASVDDGCTTDAPLCLGAGTASARCQPCADSTAGGTDLGCTSAAPACVTGSGGTNVCLACEDSATGATPDNGCAVPTPICVAATGGAPTCVACTEDSHCPLGTVCNAALTCVPGCHGDHDCAGSPGAPVCDTSIGACAECNDATDCHGTQLCDAHACAQPDTDGDGIPDDLDLDDDNDGIPDALEIDPALLGDANGNGILDFQDPAFQPADFDCEPNAAGVCTRLPESVDFDGDGIPNHLDLDADGDGILDVVEGGGSASDDGTIADFVDLNGNGLADAVEADPLPIPNTDGEDGPDFLDLDADGDGLFDSIEGGFTGSIDEDGRPVGDDTNGDGVLDELIGDGQLPIPDTDGDGVPDYQDPDDDGDGILTRFEAPDANGDGIPDDARDTDGDGVPDYLDPDDDGDGIPTRDEEPDPDGDGDPADARDSDGNGVPDYLDPGHLMGDAGVPDAGTPDGGVADAGALDAGGEDAGTSPGGFAGGACGCVVNSTTGSSGLLPLLGLLGLVLLRRRARARRKA